MKSLNNGLFKTGVLNFRWCKNKSSLTRHKKNYCKGENNKKYENEIKELKKKILDLEKNSKNVTYNTYINKNSIQNIQNNKIELRRYGCEDTELGFDEWRRVYNKGLNSIPEYIKTLHFNDKYPENQNIKITNMRSGYVNVFDGENWTIKDKNSSLESLYEKGKNDIDDGHERIIVDLNSNVYTDKEIKAMEKAIERYKKHKDDIDRCPKTRKHIDREITTLLYNGRNKVIKS